MSAADWYDLFLVCLVSASVLSMTLAIIAEWRPPAPPTRTHRKKDTPHDRRTD